MGVKGAWWEGGMGAGCCSGVWEQKMSEEGELTYTVFTNAVGGVEGAAHQAGGGGQVDDAAVGLDGAQLSAKAAECTGEVCVEDVIPFFVSFLYDGGGQGLFAVDLCVVYDV